jgi:hypothetical protein
MGEKVCKRLPLLVLFTLSFFPIFSQDLPSDLHATKETIALYRHFRQRGVSGSLFGHHDDLAYGYGWKYQERQKRACSKKISPEANRTAKTDSLEEIFLNG